MQRVIDEMTKAKGDVERELRKYIPEIIKECMAFSYLGKTFTFDIQDLSDRVNERLVSLSDAIHEDIESRAKTAIKYAEEEDDEDIILVYSFGHFIGRHFPLDISILDAWQSRRAQVNDNFDGHLHRGHHV